MMFKKIALFVIILLIAIQFIPIKRNLSTAASPNSIEQKYQIPDDVNKILKKACYDCHSNHTEYLWYASIQPIGFWIQKHINNGKEELNFSEFLTYSDKKASHKIKEVIEVLEENEMPLSSYTLIHKDAKLTTAEKERVINWASQLTLK